LSAALHAFRASCTSRVAVSTVALRVRIAAWTS
jgi:hypothetical protein